MMFKKKKRNNSFEAQIIYNAADKYDIQDAKRLELIDALVKKQKGKTASYTRWWLFAAALFMPTFLEEKANDWPIHPWFIFAFLILFGSALILIYRMRAVSDIIKMHDCNKCETPFAFWYKSSIVKKGKVMEERKRIATDCPFETKIIETKRQLQFSFDVWECLECGKEEEYLTKTKDVLLDKETYYTCDHCDAINTISCTKNNHVEKRRYTDRTSESGGSGENWLGKYHYEWVKCIQYAEYENIKRYRCSDCGYEETVREDAGKKKINEWTEDKHEVYDN